MKAVSLTPHMAQALRVLDEKGSLSDADGFTLRTARALERRGSIKIRVWAAYKTPLSKQRTGWGWSAEKA